MYSNVQMTHRLVARLAYTTTNKSIARLASIEIHTSTFNTEYGVFRYGIKKHECITFQSLDCDEPSYDQYEQTMDTIGCSPDSSQPANVLEGMNILLRGALGTGEKTVAHAICNMLKRPMLDVRANDIPYLADLAIEWNALVVIDHGDALLKPFSAAIKFLDLDLAACRQCWLQVDNLSTISSSKHAPVPTMRDTKMWTFLWEIEKISW
ncbi:uncharacterized protein HD556DRAFT_1311678 [Suillus plorans]|uniref:Uncharacterized protein n=1 Tax=Suillus plorans TaxID=116603 RepID=A0A9P7AHG6_9AGAM|nr:uncharacterized protein HD556DRAFT_1311678 [Suillus plorans]KAG1788929.1 hypothetical protein HD556DRAFT_1311678 [Suillus plorans]